MIDAWRFETPGYPTFQAFRIDGEFIITYGRLAGKRYPGFRTVIERSRAAKRALNIILQSDDFGCCRRTLDTDRVSIVRTRETGLQNGYAFTIESKIVGPLLPVCSIFRGVDSRLRDLRQSARDAPNR